jgi:anthranilate synthase component 1
VPGYACRWLDHSPDLAGLSERFPEQFPYLLESAAHGRLGSHSLLLYAGDQKLVLQPGSDLSGPGNGSSFLQRFESWYQAERLAQVSRGPEMCPGVPFSGGWFVYLGYEVAAEIEPSLNLPENRTGLPDAIAHRCPGAVIILHDPEIRATPRENWNGLKKRTRSGLKIR